MKLTSASNGLKFGRRFLVCAGLFFLALAYPTLATDIVWTNTAGGNWSVATNWSPNSVPNSGDNAYITLDGTYLVTLDVSTTIGNLTVGGSNGLKAISDGSNFLTIVGVGSINTNGVFMFGGGTLSGTLDVAGRLNWSGGTVSGALTVATNGTLDISGSTNTTLSAGAGTGFTNWGTVVWAGGDIDFDLTDFYNQPGALFDIRCNQSLSNQSGSAFYNAGLFRKSSGSGASTVAALPFFNSGVIEPLLGVLSFGDGDLNLLPTGALQFLIRGESAPVNYGQLAVSGSVTLGGFLDVGLTNGFVPNAGDSFQIIAWASRQGGFSQANGFNLTNGLYFQGIVNQLGLALVAKTTNVPVATPPTNLASQIVALGDTATFSFSPVGVSPLSYQWSFDGTNLSGQTNATLVIPNVQSNSFGTYCAMVTDALKVSNTVLRQPVGHRPGGPCQPTERVDYPQRHQLHPDRLWHRRRHPSLPVAAQR